MVRPVAIFFAVVLLAGASCLRLPQNSLPQAPPSARTETVKFVGIVQNVRLDASHFDLQLIDGVRESIRWEEGVSFETDGEKSSAEIFLKNGVLVEVYGTRDRSSLEVTARTIRARDRENIVVFFPEPEATVTSPLLVGGFARTFENSYVWRVKDSMGTERASGFGTAAATEVGTFGPFQFEVYLPTLPEKNFTLDVFSLSAADGSEQNLVSVPLRLLSERTSTFQIFLQKNRLNPTASCSSVFPVSRTVAQTATEGRAALHELLSGPTQEEILQGYDTQIPNGFIIRSFVISGGVATITLVSPVGNPCQEEGIEAQIRETLQQFPIVKEVEIVHGGI